MSQAAVSAASPQPPSAAARHNGQPSSAVPQPAGLLVEAWRDPLPEVRVRPGMALGRYEIAGDWARWADRLHQEGARAVRLAEPVRLCAGDAGPLALVRELTSRGVAVEWQARCRPGCADPEMLGHLWPPLRVDCGADSDAVTQAWRERFFPAKCVYRQGPGFIEVRDRRFGALDLLTVDEPEWLVAIEAMAEGAAVASVPAVVRTAFAEARLVLERDGRLWWLPARIRRWPFPPLSV